MLDGIIFIIILLNSFHMNSVPWTIYDDLHWTRSWLAFSLFSRNILFLGSVMLHYVLCAAILLHVLTSEDYLCSCYLSGLLLFPRSPRIYIIPVLWSLAYRLISNLIGSYNCFTNTLNTFFSTNTVGKIDVFFFCCVAQTIV